MPTVVLFSGPIAVGKSSVARELLERFSFDRVSTGTYLSQLAQQRGTAVSRTSLQEIGDRLDEESDYRWVIDNVAVSTIASKPNVTHWLLDSVRKHRQVHHFRHHYGSSIAHVHLTASETILEARYNARLIAGGEYAGNTPYSVAIQHPNEISSRSLIDVADLVINVEGRSSNDIATEIATYTTPRRA